MDLFLIGLIEKYPMIASVIAVMVTVRYVVKALEVGVDAFVKATPKTTDDLYVSGIKAQGWYKALAKVLDFAVSVKLPTK